MHADHQQSRFQCPIDPRSNLPVALAKTPCNPGGCQTGEPSTDGETVNPPCSSCSRHSIVGFSVLEETNQNITAAQKDLLLWNFRLGHLGFAHLQHLMRPRTVEDLRSTIKTEKPVIIDPCLVPKNPSTRTCKPPLCASCQIARAKRRSTDVSTTTVHQEALLKVSDLQPGDRVSIDQYESSVRGRLATTRGKESFGHKYYAGGTIFCDHASGYVYCSHQVSLRATDTVISKRAFERSAKSCGVKVEKYHGDNGVFKSKEFTDSLTKPASGSQTRTKTLRRRRASPKWRCRAQYQDRHRKGPHHDAPARLHALARRVPSSTLALRPRLRMLVAQPHAEQLLALMGAARAPKSIANTCNVLTSGAAHHMS